LQAELSKAQAGRIQKEAQLNLAQVAQPESLPMILDDPGFRQAQIKLADLRREYADLMTMQTPANPQAIRIDAQIKETESAIQQLRQSALDRVKNEYREAQQREDLLSGSYAQQAGSVSYQSIAAIHYNTLKREVDTTRELYETMLKRVNDAQIANALRSGDIRVIDDASIPLNPSGPGGNLLGAIGGICGFLGVLTFVFIDAHANRKIQQPGHASQLLNTPELGVMLSERPSMAKRMIGMLPLPANEPESGVFNQNWAAVMQADAATGIVNSILFNERVPRIILVTSPLQGEGKTTTACNLASAFAKRGIRCLLIDGDFRRPSLGKVFRCPHAKGMLDYLSNKSDGRNKIESYIAPTEFENLSVLPAGMASKPVDAVMYSHGVAQLLKELSRDYMILIDSAPLLLAPESRMLGHLAHGVVLVLRSGQTRTEVALAARQRLREDGSNLLGTILSDWNPRSSVNRYYKYY
jgi:capsular exopolysaccharide synthesis family protein